MIPTRPMTPADQTDALLLYDVLRGARPTAQDPAAFARVLAHPGTTIWGAEAAGHLRAMATLHILPNMTNGGRPYALIENVATHPDHRGTGLGRAVMTACAQAASAEECYKIMLLTGTGSAAIGFYERLGYASDQKQGMQMRHLPQRDYKKR